MDSVRPRGRGSFRGRPRSFSPGRGSPRNAYRRSPSPQFRNGDFKPRGGRPGLVRGGPSLRGGRFTRNRGGPIFREDRGPPPREPLIDSYRGRREPPFYGNRPAPPYERERSPIPPRRDYVPPTRGSYGGGYGRGRFDPRDRTFGSPLGGLERGRFPRERPYSPEPFGYPERRPYSPPRREYPPNDHLGFQRSGPPSSRMESYRPPERRPLPPPNHTTDDSFRRRGPPPRAGYDNGPVPVKRFRSDMDNVRGPPPFRDDRSRRVPMRAMSPSH